MKQKSDFPPLRNPLTGERQYRGAMWEYREVDPGVVEMRVTYTAQRWKMEGQVPMCQDVGHQFCDGPWVPVHGSIPLSIQLFFSRFARGENIVGEPRPPEVPHGK